MIGYRLSNHLRSNLSTHHQKSQPASAKPFVLHLAKTKVMAIAMPKLFTHGY